jgi:hypothetical protein
MAGLLQGLGYMVGGAMEGAGKAAEKSFFEKMKEEALATREANLQRFTTKEREESQNFHTAEAKTTRELTASESKATRELTQKLHDESAMNAVTLQDSANEAAARRAEEVQNQESMRQDKTIEANKDSATEAVANAERLLKYKNDLPDKEKLPIEKTIKFLVDSGMPKDKALALALSPLTKEEAAEDRDQLRLWQNTFIDLRKDAKSGDAAAAEATRLTGVDPLAIVARRASGKGVPAAKPTGEFDLKDFLGKIKTAGTEGSKKEFIEPDNSLGLVGRETRNPTESFVDKRSPEMKAAQGNLRGAATKVKTVFLNVRARAEEERKRLEEDRKKKEEEERTKAKNR